MSKCRYLEYRIDSTGKREYYCPKRHKEVDPIANCKFCNDYFENFETNIIKPLKCRSDYEEGYARGFADGYERALRNTPTFPITTSPAHIYYDKELMKQIWHLVDEELPEMCKAVLVWCPERHNIFCAILNYDKQWEIFGTSNLLDEKVVAWRELPTYTIE